MELIASGSWILLFTLRKLESNSRNGRSNSWAIVEMGEPMRSEPLNNCHWDEVTPIASSHSALIFSSGCSAVPITFTFTAVPASTFSFTAVLSLSPCIPAQGCPAFTVHCKFTAVISANTFDSNLQPRGIQYSQCTSLCATANTFTLNLNI